MDKLSTGQKIAGGGALLLFISAFLPWYSVFGFSINALDSGFLAWAGVILGVLAGVFVVMKGLGHEERSIGGLPAEQLALVLAVLSLILIALRFITQSTASAFGMYLGLIAAAVTAYGCFQNMKAQGMTVDDMKQRFSGGSTPGAGSPPPPAP